MELQIGQDRLEGVSRKEGIWSCQSLVKNNKLVIATAGLIQADMVGLTDTHSHFNWKRYRDVEVKRIFPLSSAWQHSH